MTPNFDSEVQFFLSVDVKRDHIFFFYKQKALLVRKRVNVPKQSIMNDSPRVQLQPFFAFTPPLYSPAQYKQGTIKYWAIRQLIAIKGGERLVTLFAYRKVLERENRHAKPFPPGFAADTSSCL